MNITLYKLADDYLVAQDKLSDLDLPDDVIRDTLESMEGDLQVKATNTGLFIRNLEVTSEAIAAEEKRLSERRKAIDNRVNNIKRYLFENMQRTGITKIESPSLTLSLQNNPASVSVENVSDIPSEYMRQKEAPPPEPDKNAIKEALKNGIDVPGCTLVTTQRLVIK